MRLASRLLSFVLFIAFIVVASAQSDTVQRHTLENVTIHGGVNPADLIMRQVAEHRDSNSAYNSLSFKYITYHKMSLQPSYLSDSLRALEDQHLFLSESVTEVYFKHPSKHYERMIAAKTSGLEDPAVNLILSRVHFHNLYADDDFSIMDVAYVSPLAKKSLKLYDYQIIDSIETGSDTIVSLSYAPRSGVAFRSLKGKLYVHLGDYAVTRLEAMPTDPNTILKIRVAHEYEKAENGYWFPKRMEARLKMPRIALRGDTMESFALATATIKDLEIDLPLRNNVFGLIDVEEDVASERASESHLETYRDSLLTIKESKTYEMWDSLSRKLKLTRRWKMLPSLMRLCIPVGPIDIDVASIVNRGQTEGWRVGLGLYTNERLARWCKLGGYFAYGFGDKQWKWFVMTDWELERKHSLMLKLRFYDEIVESGASRWVSRDESGLLNGEYYRHWILDHYDRSRALTGRLQMRVDKNITLNVAAGYSQNHTLYPYRFQSEEIPEENPFFSFTNCYVSGGVRFAYHETTYRTRNMAFYQRSKFPTLQITYEHGLPHVFGSGYSYNKLNARIHHLQQYKILGYSEIAIVGGWLDRTLPYSLLFVMPSGYSKIGFYGREQFATMRPSEFVADAYMALFFRHNFGKMREGIFSPRIVICQNIGFGWMRWSGDHLGVEAGGMKKGYFESGIVIEDILTARDLLGLGIGIFYRYGPYSLDKVIDNFAFKVSLTVPMGE